MSCSQRESIWRAPVDHFDIGYALQPIVPTREASSLRGAGLARVEVLARPTLGRGQTVSDWFSRAKRAGKLPETDLALVSGLSRRIASSIDELQLSINVSPESIECPSSFGRLVNALATLKEHAKSLCIEITEHSSFKNPALVHSRLKLLRSMDFAVALDDFGVGSNHILLVASGAVSEIKLDRAWLASVVQPKQLESMVKFAHSLALDVVAEGVESASDLRRATDAGCDFVQGYLLGSPVPLRPTATTTY